MHCGALWRRVANTKWHTYTPTYHHTPTDIRARGWRMIGFRSGSIQSTGISPPTEGTGIWKNIREFH